MLEGKRLIEELREFLFNDDEQYEIQIELLEKVVRFAGADDKGYLIKEKIKLIEMFLDENRDEDIITEILNGIYPDGNIGLNSIDIDSYVEKLLQLRVNIKETVDSAMEYVIKKVIKREIGSDFDKFYDTCSTGEQKLLALAWEVDNREHIKIYTIEIPSDMLYLISSSFKNIAIEILKYSL